MGPTLSDPIPELIHRRTEWIRPDPIRYRSLCILFRNGSDPIRSDTGAYTSSPGMGPTLSDQIPELIQCIMICNRAHPIRYRCLCISFRNGSAPIRSDTEVVAFFAGMDPILYDPKPKLSLFLRNGSDPIRSGTKAYISSSELNPTRSDPIPKLYSMLRCATYHIRSDTGGCTLSFGRDPIMSDPIPKLTPESESGYGNGGLDPRRYSCGAFLVAGRSRYEVAFPVNGTERVRREIPRCGHYLLRAFGGLDPRRYSCGAFLVAGRSRYEVAFPENGTEHLASSMKNPNKYKNLIS
jgi:hypothetical protein